VACQIQNFSSSEGKLTPASGYTIPKQWIGRGKRQASQLLPEGPNVDPIEGVGYYLSGRVNGTAVDGLLSCNLSKWNFKNKTIPWHSAAGAFLEYIPVGKKGVLVFFGGNSSTSTLVGAFSSFTLDNKFIFL